MTYLLGGGYGQGQMSPQYFPQFTPTGRGGISSFLFGTPESMVTNPLQMQLMQQLIQGIGPGIGQGTDFLTKLLSGDESIFKEIEAPMIRQFEQQTVPGLAERFTAQGSGGQSSSAYQQQLGAAGSRLAQDLASQRAGYRMSALDRLLSQAQAASSMQPYSFVPRTPGFFESLIGSIPSAIAAYSGGRNR